MLRMIPGLAEAEFVRLGSLHRNTFINSPRGAAADVAAAAREPTAFLAGQLIGVEGYVESAASGMLAGINAVRLLERPPCVVPPATTALGSLLAYVTDAARRDFQPMNANYGLFPAMAAGPRPRAARRARRNAPCRAAADWLAGAGLVDEIGARQQSRLRSAVTDRGHAEEHRLPAGLCGLCGGRVHD